MTKKELKMKEVKNIFKTKAEILLDVLVKVGVKDYVKEIIYDYELDEDEQKLLEDFIKEE